MNRADLSADQQAAILADRYSQRADAYDQLWSPVIRPPGELLSDEHYVYRGEVVVAIAQKAVGGHTLGEQNG